LKNYLMTILFQKRKDRPLRESTTQRIREYPSRRDEAEAPPSEKANTWRGSWSVRDG
jgi:hypothetical protein